MSQGAYDLYASVVLSEKRSKTCDVTEQFLRTPTIKDGYGLGGFSGDPFPKGERWTKFASWREYKTHVLAASAFYSCLALGASTLVAVTSSAFGSEGAEELIPIFTIGGLTSRIAFSLARRTMLAVPFVVADYCARNVIKSTSPDTGTHEPHGEPSRGASDQRRSAGSSHQPTL